MLLNAASDEGLHCLQVSQQVLDAGTGSKNRHVQNFRIHVGKTLSYHILRLNMVASFIKNLLKILHQIFLLIKNCMQHGSRQDTFFFFFFFQKK